MEEKVQNALLDSSGGNFDNFLHKKFSDTIPYYITLTIKAANKIVKFSTTTVPKSFLNFFFHVSAAQSTTGISYFDMNKSFSTTTTVTPILCPPSDNETDQWFVLNKTLIEGDYGTYGACVNNLCGDPETVAYEHTVEEDGKLKITYTCEFIGRANTLCSLNGAVLVDFHGKGDGLIVMGIT